MSSQIYTDKQVMSIGGNIIITVSFHNFSVNHTKPIDIVSYYVYYA